MTCTQKYFLYILRCFYLDIECTPPNQEVKMDELYNLATIHGVQCIVFAKIKDISSLSDNEYYQKLRLDFFGLTMNSIVTEENLNTLTKLLNEHGYNHILFKGAVVKSFYPSKELRTMGDIDILVEAKDYEEIHKLLLENNFKYDSFGSESLTQAYDFNNTHFEVHTSLANKNSFIHSADYLTFFSDAFEHAVKIKDCTYTLEATYHFIFLLYHLERHFERNGFGVRMLLDFPFFYDKNQLDTELFQGWLKALNLTDFASCIFTVCNELFGSNLPVNTKKLDDKLSEFLLNKVLTKGTFGVSGGDEDSRKLLWVQFKYGYDSTTKSGKIKTLLRWIFPKRQDLCDLCLCKEDTPLFKMPLIYIGRIAKAVKRRNIYRKKKLNADLINKNTDNDYLYFNLLKDFGIKR